MRSKLLHLTNRLEILGVRQKKVIAYSRFRGEYIVIPKHIREHTRETIDRYMRENLPLSYTLIDLSISGKRCVGLAVKKDYDWFITDAEDIILARSDNLRGISSSKLYEREYRKIEIAGERKLYVLRDKFHIGTTKPEQQVLDDLAHSHLEEHKEGIPTNLGDSIGFSKRILEKASKNSLWPNIFKGINYTEEEKRRLIGIFHKQDTPLSKLDPFERRFMIEPDSETVKNTLVELDLSKIEARLLANNLPKTLFGENKMSVSHKVNTLMNVTGIKVRFRDTSTEYTYKTLLPNVKVDEEIVVETSTGSAIATITKILGKVSQEVTEEIIGMGYDNIKWAFQSVADLRLQELKDTEKELYDNIVLAEGITANKEVLQDLEESIGKENVTELKAKVSRLE